MNDPIDIIFDSVSDLTGGLITDLTTLVVGVTILIFLGMAINLLMVVLLGTQRTEKRYTDDERSHNEWSNRGNVDSDVKNLNYRKLLREFKDYED